MLKNHKRLVLAVSGLLALVLLLLAVLGTVSLVRSSRAVYSYRGQTVDVGEYAYFASVYKNRFMKECLSAGVVGVADTDAFWQRTDEKSGKTYGQTYLESLDAYLRSLLVAADLFDSSVGMTRARKKELRAELEAILYDRTGGDVRAFNEATAEYGFTYSDFEDAAELAYKQATLFSMVRMSAAETVGSMADICEEFLTTQYTHVKMIFIRTENVFCYGEDGNRLTDENTGADMTRPLTDAEREQRLQDIAAVQDAITRLENRENGAITSVMFDLYAQAYEKDGDDSYRESGYYFANGESFTAQMQEEFPEIVNTALQMESGSYRIVSYDTGDFVGSCILYCLPHEIGAYANEETEAMFLDFYSGAAEYYVWKNISDQTAEVRVGKRLAEVSALEIARNYYYAVSFA